MNDSLGDYLKSLEREQNGRISSKDNYIYMRIDGRSFSKVTRHMSKPFDMNFHGFMNAVVDQLYAEFRPDLLMKQSDEISLLWKPVVPPTEIVFGGKDSKLMSLVPSFASSVLSLLLFKVVTFDARIIECNKDDALKFMWWRYKDCTKNAISQTAYSLHSEKKLANKGTTERFNLIQNEKVWTEAPCEIKHGYWIFKETTEEGSSPKQLKIEDRLEYYSTFCEVFDKII